MQNYNNNLFIIGKRSNLSRELACTLNGPRLISGDEIQQLPELLIRAGRSDIIYNLYHKSSWLGRRDMPKDYARYSFQRLAEFTSICRDSQHYINKVIFTSSSAVYGNNALATESDRCDITNLYASLKFASELFLSEHLADTHISLVIARLFNMYGGDDSFSVVAKIANALSQRAKFQLSNHGGSVRDFVHIRNVVEIYQRLLTSSFCGVVNVASGKGLSVSDLIVKAETAFRRRIQVEHVVRPEIDRSVACIDTLVRAVGPMEFNSVDKYYLEQYTANG